MNIGGWQRLWILVTGIYLILVAVFVVMTFPNPEDIRHSQTLYNQLTPEYKGKILGKENSEKYRSEKAPYLEEAKRRDLITAVEMPNGHLMLFSSELPEKEMEAVAKEYWKVVENTATKKRINYLGFAFLCWLVPVIALYGLGWSMGWVYRGFRK